MIAAVILAAGGSSRLGQPKQLIVLAGETLLERAVRVAREAGCEPVVVVLGPEAERIKAGCNLGSAQVILNSGWAEGMASSIRAGLEAVPAARGAVLMTCDQPAVTPEHLRGLLSTGSVTASAYAGRRGVPAYFPSTSFPDLARLTGDTGARELLRDAPTVELPGGELDLDTEAEVQQARQRIS